MIKVTDTQKMNAIGLCALAVGSFGIGVTEFVIMGLLPQLSQSLSVSLPTAGLLISGYAMGVVVGAPILTMITSKWSQKSLLIFLMIIFTLGNMGCAIASSYSLLMIFRIVTSLAHGTYFGVGSLVATKLVPPEKKSSAIALMFTGLTLANILGVPFGTWLGLIFGWRSTFWAVAMIGILAAVILAKFLPFFPIDIDQDNIFGWKKELEVLGRSTVMISILTTVFGDAGIFLLFTYITPILTKVTHISEHWVAPILLLFGVGLVIGNILGGKLADKNLHRSVFITLSALFVVLIATYWTMSWKITAIISMFLLGIAMFATVAPLQSFVLECAKPVNGQLTSNLGQALASSLNISAFNLGNAMGAWIGSLLLTYHFGFSSLSLAAACMPILAILLAQWNIGKIK